MKFGTRILFFSCLLIVSFVADQSMLLAASDGREIYQNNCLGCHGESGDGMSRARHGLNPPPRDFTSPLAKAELTRDRMLDSVRQGRPGTAMMPFSAKLSAAQIAAVVDYVQATYMQGPAIAVNETMKTLEHGKRIFISNCAVCHGDNGNGAMWTTASLNPPPRDFTSPVAREELSRERMITSVTHGRPGTAMMAFNARLSDSDIGAVVEYIRQTFMRTEVQDPAPIQNPHQALAPARPIVAADLSMAFPNGLAGDVAKGRAFYMNNCFTCHGVEGNGEGPRSSFIVPRPRNFLADESRLTLNRPALMKAIALGKPGTVMPAWSKVLTDQEIADVAEFVFQQFIQAEQKSSQNITEKKKAPL